MKKFGLLLVSMLVMSVFTANADDVEDAYRYELEALDGVASEGRVLMKVWSYGKKEKLTRQKCMANAVHGIIFKGAPAGGSAGLVKGSKAICPEGFVAHKDYFENFFENGEYLQFVELTNNGNIQPGDRIKISSKEYKVGMCVIVNYNALRQKLEGDGIAKGLNFLF